MLRFRPEKPRWGCTWGLFHDWIIYGENERHAACVPNVSVCATARSPELTSKSVPLVQLRVMGNRSVSWAYGFSPSWTWRSLYRGKQAAPKPWRAVNRNMDARVGGVKWVCLLDLAVYVPLVDLSTSCSANPVLSNVGGACKAFLHPTTRGRHGCIHHLSIQSKQEMFWPSAAAAARCWDESTRRWFPCFYGSPSGFPSSAWAAAWKRVFLSLILDLGKSQNIEPCPCLEPI